MLILLDSKPLGMVTNPKATPDTDKCNEWLEELLVNNVKIRIPEIIDYELRRELIRLGHQGEKSIALLDYLAIRLGYVKVDTETFLLAASLWAKVRNAGKGTAGPQRLDIDCILAAQAHKISATNNEEIIIATVDVDDLSRYDTATVKAKLWSDIKPTL